jgi:uncharacterized protein (DUF885 family)
MTRFNVAGSLAAGALALAACGGPSAAPPPPSAPLRPVEELNRVVEGYWDAHLQLNPLAGADRRLEARLGNTISTQYLADTLALERRALGELARVPPPGSDAEARLTYEMFRRGRELAIEALTFPSELLPVNSADSMPQQFAVLARDADPQVLPALIDEYVAWNRQAIANLRDGVRRGYTLPPEIVERLLPQLARVARDVPDNPLFDAARGPDGARVLEAVRQKLLPAYRELHDYLDAEYLPAAKNGTPWRSWPLHQAWYAHLIHRYTGTQMSPQELHRLGRTEADRLRERLLAVLAGAGFAGNPAGFLESLHRDPLRAPLQPAQILAAYAELRTTLDAPLQEFFGELPQAEVTIRAVEAFREADAAPVFYAPAAAAGGRPLLYVNTSAAAVEANPGREALYMNGALPGHQLQSSVQRQAAVPRFRRYGDEPAFVEGWALYVEGLGDEMGVYRDAGAQYGALLDQWRHAAALVVDTGMFAQGWSRRQALEYLHTQLPQSDAAEADLVDRCLALPGQALAATSGAVHLRALRRGAQEKLGARFQNAEFHRQVLAAGALPLDLLDGRIKRWIDSNR